MKTILIISLMIFASLTSLSQSTSASKAQKTRVMKTDKEWKAQLTPIQYNVTRESGTERPFTGEYWNHFEKGHYVCVCCGAHLFDSDTKFASGCGWPSFYEQSKAKNIVFKDDYTHNMIRTEVRCKICDAHLGHVFDDGPPPTGKRFCINSASIKFIENQ